MPSRQDRSRRCADCGWVLFGGVLVLVLVGCGGGEAAPRELPGAAEQLLTQSDLDRYPPPTPEHALLQWWRDAQYSNFAGYVNAFAPSVRSSLKHDPDTVAALTYFFATVRTARPKIVSVRRGASSVTLYTDIDYRTPIGTTRYVTTSRPQAFVLVRRNGRWLLQDDSFVQATLPARLRREGD